MCILSDYSIKQRINELFNSPISLNDIQPASVDLHLNKELKTITGEQFIIGRNADYELQPDEFILGSTKEIITIPNDLVGIVDGKSSIGRLGIMVHVTAGYIDPGFKGNVTLEIKNVSDQLFVLKESMSICQIIFQTLTTPVSRSYGDDVLNNHYQNSQGTVLSKM